MLLNYTSLIEDKTDWNKLPKAIQNHLNEALLESKRNEGIEHNQVIKFIKEKHPEYENFMASERIEEFFSNL